jgi:hypothetical protein
MAKIQTQFEKFHGIIRADYEMSQTLQEKRDIILNRIYKHLKDNGRPSFDVLLQGSYKMKTGVIPIANLEYDIDVGLRFAFSENDYSAKTVRQWIFEAVDGHTEKVEEKGPCIRVTYADGYHVDLVMYACWTDVQLREQCRLAHKTREWVPADPAKLLEYVREARKPFEGTEDSAFKTDQFRRIVRYLRRANDVRIPRESDAKPTGLALVLLCRDTLQPCRDWAGDTDDRTALEQLAARAAASPGRIVAQKPTPEYEDMFARLSDDEMAKLKSWFAAIASALQEADNTKDPVEACKKLRAIFGDDFPVPLPEETAKKSSGPAIVTSSSSA